MLSRDPLVALFHPKGPQGRSCAQGALPRVQRGLVAHLEATRAPLLASEGPSALSGNQGPLISLRRPCRFRGPRRLFPALENTFRRHCTSRTSVPRAALRNFYLGAMVNSESGRSSGRRRGLFFVADVRNREEFTEILSILEACRRLRRLRNWRCCVHYSWRTGTDGTEHLLTRSYWDERNW